MRSNDAETDLLKTQRKSAQRLALALALVALGIYAWAILSRL